MLLRGITLALLLGSSQGEEKIRLGLDQIHEMAQLTKVPSEFEPLDKLFYFMKQNNATSLEKRNEVGMTALSVAASRGNFRYMEALLSNGAKVNAQDDRGRTALHWVFQQPHERKELKKRIDLLVNSGAHVAMRDKDGLTPMHMAVHTGHVAGIRILKRNRHSLEEQSPHGTPLHFAAMLGQWEAIRILAKAGANLEALHLGYPPMHCAAMTEQPAAIKALAKVGANVDSKNDKGMTALHFSLGLGKLRSIRALIWAGADLDAEYNGLTVFEIAGTNKTLLKALSTPKDKSEKVEHNYLDEPSKKQASRTDKASKDEL
uniref:Uncharacterized protein n=1 Tax=Haptolina brevifila TaxID=156173 RepID=A0A7S2H130_9EUKA|mmetsp:Transcript_49986/g.99550  ORF Transcript_49986/g.99550 Transcript_49986/m.99550 type:complete len:318 (+) Transcript_49986:94-1047(+)